MESATALNGKKILPVLALCAFLIGLDSLVVIPLVPAIAKDLGFQLDLGGLLVTAYALLYGFSAPLFGPLSDRIGRKKMIMSGMLVFSVGTALTAFATDLNTALIFRAVAGLGGAMVMPSVFALLGDAFSYEQRGKAMGAVMGAMVGSTVLGVPLGTFLAQFGSWELTFGIVAALGGLLFLIAMGAIPATPPKNEIPVGPVKAYFGQFKTAFSNPSVFFALLTTFLWTAGLHGMFAYVGVYYTENFNFDIAQIGFVIFAAGLGSVIGNVIGGRLADKVGKKTVVAFASVVAAAGVLAFALLTNAVVAAIVAHVIWSTAIGFGQASLTALVSELSPKVRGTVMSLNSSAMYTGMMSATAISALLMQNGTFLQIGILCAIASILCMPVTSFFVKEHSAADAAQQGVAGK